MAISTTELIIVNRFSCNPSILYFTFSCNPSFLYFKKFSLTSYKHHIARYRCQKANPSTTKKLMDVRPPDLSKNVCWMNVTWYLWHIHYYQNQISMVFADGLAPIWHQGICKHCDGPGRCVSAVPNVIIYHNGVCSLVSRLFHAPPVAPDWVLC